MNTDSVAHNYPASVKWPEILKLTLGYSIRMAIAWAIVFLIAKLFHLEQVVEIRFINYIIMFFVTYGLMKRYYEMNNKKMEYFSGFTIAFLAGVIGSAIYSILFFIYLQIDQRFLYFLIDQFSRKMIYPELSVAFVIFSEGFSFSLIIALSLLQYFKRKRGRWKVNQK